jgi:hypothetical protein
MKEIAASWVRPLAIFFVIIDFMFEKLSRGSFLALFILSQFFFNFGELAACPLHRCVCKHN